MKQTLIEGIQELNNKREAMIRMQPKVAKLAQHHGVRVLIH